MTNDQKAILALTAEVEALRARLAEAEALLREAKQPLHDQMHYREEQCDARFSAYRASRVNEVYDLLRRIDAFLTPAPPAPDPAG